MPNGDVDYGEIRHKIHEVLSEIIDEEENESTLLAGWSLIWEGVHENNRRSLTFLTSDATGDAPLTPWAARGFMNHILEWFFGTVEEDEEIEDEYDEED